MATSVQTTIDPSSFGPASTVLVFSADPDLTGSLLCVADKTTTGNIQIPSGCESVYVRVYDASDRKYTAFCAPVTGGTVTVNAGTLADAGTSRSVDVNAVMSRDDDDEGAAAQTLDYWLNYFLNPENYQWIIPCEDLGSIGDYDFNDVVIGVTYNSGAKKLYIYPLTAGGVLKAEVYYGDERCFEIHEALGVSQSTMKNTRSYEGTGNAHVIDNVESFDISQLMGGIKVKVSGDSEAVWVTAPKEGTPPQMICVPRGWEWPKETISITETYPEFSAWNSNATLSDWDSNGVDSKMVLRFDRHEFTVTTTNGADATVKINNSTNCTVKSGKKCKFNGNLTSCYQMFYNANGSPFTNIDVSKLNTGKVTNMQYMFQNCSWLESINLSMFNTAKVTNMSYMFHRCVRLQSLDLSSFNTAKVKDMQYMFLATL